MKQMFAALLMLIFLQPATAQRNYNKAKDPLQIITVKVQGGSFDLGADDQTQDRKPLHTVVLSNFSMGAYEITQDQWYDVMGKNPSIYDCGQCAVTNVSWDDVQEFLKKLNSQTGKHYRLPTEAEWEYAARGGATEKMTWDKNHDNNIVARGGVNELLVSDDNRKIPAKEKQGKYYAGKNNPGTVAWFSRNSEDHVHPIGRKKPNAIGIYDMSGNVEEWCNDFYATGYGSKSTTADPKGPDGGRSHVVRGGSWASNAEEVGVTRRAAYLPNTKSSSLGFRVVEDAK